MKSNVVVTYSMPAPLGWWLPSAFLCMPYRLPCPPNAVSCNPETQPLLNPQPCDYSNPDLSGKYLSDRPVGDTDGEYPFPCAPGVVGNAYGHSCQQVTARGLGSFKGWGQSVLSCP